MHDLISRQAAIDALDCINGVEEVLRSLPSVQPERTEERTETHACDLISRQDAIDALDVLCQEHRYKIPGKRETYSQYSEAWQDALDRAEGAIFNLPSAQPEQRWIPCSERLPEEETDVLVCNADGDINISRGSYSTEAKNEFIWYTSGWRFGKVLAWMPLPEPYGGEQNEAN